MTHISVNMSCRHVFFLLALCLAHSHAEEAFFAGLQLLYTGFRQCQDQLDTTSCLKLKALRALDRALTSDTITLVDGVTIKKIPGSVTGRALTAIDDATLTKDPVMLDELLVDRVEKFMQGHTVQLRVPRYISELAAQEGRKKDKKGGLLLMALMMKGWMAAMAYKGVAVLAAKALMVAKVALVLAGVAALSKLSGGGDGGKTTVEIVKHPHVSHSYSHSSSHLGGEHYDSSGGGGHGWGRSLDAHRLAYSGHMVQGEGQVETVAL